MNEIIVATILILSAKMFFGIFGMNLLFIMSLETELWSGLLLM